jgi:hypothetical protein
MLPRLMSPNTLVSVLSPSDFDDQYPDFTCFGATLELAIASSDVRADCGRFHFDILATFGLHGFFLLSRASRPADLSRRSDPRVDVPNPNADHPRRVSLLPEVVGEYIDSGWICGSSHVPEGVFDVSIFYPVRLNQS